MQAMGSNSTFMKEDHCDHIDVGAQPHNISAVVRSELEASHQIQKKEKTHFQGYVI